MGTVDAPSTVGSPRASTRVRACGGQGRNQRGS